MRCVELTCREGSYFQSLALGFSRAFYSGGAELSLCVVEVGQVNEQDDHSIGERQPKRGSLKRSKLDIWGYLYMYVHISSCPS